MIIKSAVFTISNSDHTKCPDIDQPEYAFIGRSNVGKSSLINMITNHAKLAKTSGKPGKTQLINHFKINGSWYLVDLPGYGWAQVSKDLKEKWGVMTKNYLVTRKNLANVFVLIDSRIPPQPIDIEFVNWLGENSVPLSIVFTKADKPNSPKVLTNIEAFKKELNQTWEVLPNSIVSSSTNKTGQKEILQYIDQINSSI